MPLDVVDRKNITEVLNYFEVENSIFRDYLCFAPPKWKQTMGRGELGDYFDVVGMLIPTFL